MKYLLLCANILALLLQKHVCDYWILMFPDLDRDYDQQTDTTNDHGNDIHR